ncbi:MAG: arsenic resistance protein [Legionella sp.]|nr:MAG: arsenic resistance protein [Legionella sp.]
MKETIEKYQIYIYFVTILIAALLTFVVPGTTKLEYLINPTLAFMLFVTFLQVPLIELKNTFSNGKFIFILFLTNFVFIPILVWVLIQIMPLDPLVKLGIVFVLVTPCIDYVVTFAHLGRANAPLLLATTPILLIAQIVLLPIYLNLFFGNDAAKLVHLRPFLDAFIWLIVVPLTFAGILQLASKKSVYVTQISNTLSLLPVPATSLVLFIVIIAVLPQIGPAIDTVYKIIPIYIVYAIAAPLIGWYLSSLFHLDVPSKRAIAFSAGTRNSLVILPLAMAVPNALPVIPAVVITQTLIELFSELFYVWGIAKLGSGEQF